MRKNRKQGQDYEHVASPSHSQCENFERADHLIKLMAGRFSGSKTKKYHQTFPKVTFFCITQYTGLHLIMPKDVLIDTHVSLKQCRQAVEALHSHELKKKEKFEETQLLPGKEQHIWLNVTVKQIPVHYKLKPLKMYVLT